MLIPPTFAVAVVADAHSRFDTNHHPDWGVRLCPEMAKRTVALIITHQIRHSMAIEGMRAHVTMSHDPQKLIEYRADETNLKLPNQAGEWSTNSHVDS